MSDVVIDLLNSRTFANGQPAEMYQWLLDNEPVHWHDEPDGPGFWVVSKWEDVRAIGRDHETFSSEPTIMISDPSGDSEAREILGDHKMMLMADPPYHTRLRRLISSDFTPRSSRELQDRVNGLAAQIVDEVIEAGECDLVSDLAGEMPSYVIADLMGLPLEDGRELYKLTEILHSASDAVTAEVRNGAQTEMFTYAARVYEQKLGGDADDLSTKIVHAEVDGDSLDVFDFCLFFMLLVDAGGDTTRNLVSGGMQQLFEHPDQFELLLSDLDTHLPSAIDEMLRFVSPVIYMRRTANHDTEIRRQKIAAGDKVVMYYGAANRDPEVFERPDVFDITRTDAGKHVAFGGGGPHYCLGANLARVEIDALLREVFTRLIDLRPTAPIEWFRSNFISGPTTMPVSFTPGSRIG